MLRPTVGRLVAKVTASDPLALPMKAPIVVTTHDSISKIRAQLRPAKDGKCQPDVNQGDKSHDAPGDDQGRPAALDSYEEIERFGVCYGEHE